MIDSKTLHRLRIPAILSCVGLLATHIIYIRSASRESLTKPSRTALAVLDSRTEVIERRPTTRIIWEVLRAGDNLFSGEAVRTTSNASGKITFLKSGVTLGLEPDSLVIIEEDAGTLQLNLINGGIFVKNEANNVKGNVKNHQPIIKAGDKKVELNQTKNSELNLSVTELGAANIRVTKGDIRLADKSGNTQQLSQGDVKALSINSKVDMIDTKGPAPGAIIPVTASSDLLTVSWSKAPNSSVVYLEIGSTRETMRRSTAPVSATAGKIAAPLPAGYFFWQVTAERDGKIVGQSPAIFNQSVVLETPRLVSNANGEKTILRSDQSVANVILSWSKPAGAESTVVTISRNPRLDSIEKSQAFTSETEMPVSFSGPDTYYWIVTASWPGVTKKVSSAMGSFTVSREKDVPPPIIDASLTNQEFSKSQTDEFGIMLNWSSPQGIDSYVVKLSMEGKDGSNELLKKETISKQYRLSNIPAGSYQWSVTSKIGQTESKTAAVARFKIIDIAKLILNNSALNRNPIEFISETFNYSPQLTNIPQSTVFLRHRIRPSDTAQNTWTKSTSRQSITFAISKPGSYHLDVEAIDGNEKVIGATEPLILSFREPNLLPSPQLFSGTQKLSATELGEVSLKWRLISGAAKYVVQISGPKTKFRKETTETSLRLSGMLPGTHQLVITAIDSKGRLGKPGASVMIIVPDVSSIAAPVVKGLRVR